MSRVTERLGVLLARRREFLRWLERRGLAMAQAEDVLHEALSRALDAVEAVDRDDAVVPWFYRVLRNAVLDAGRRTGAAERAFSAWAAEARLTEEPLERRTRPCACVHRERAALKPEYASALQRLELDGLPVKAWAAEAGITPGNAAVRAHRARAALRTRVEAACGACSRDGCHDCSCEGT
jgi:RNA polymerase sigma factor (sigma-70 family)